MNEIAIDILKEKLRDCEKHKIELGSLIPDIQQVISQLENSEVVAEGKLYYEENYMVPSYYYLWNKDKQIITLSSKLNKQLDKYNGQEIIIRIEVKK